MTSRKRLPTASAFEDRDWSRRLGVASLDVLFLVLQQCSRRARRPRRERYWLLGAQKGNGTRSTKAPLLRPRLRSTAVNGLHSTSAAPSSSSIRARQSTSPRSRRGSIGTREDDEHAQRLVPREAVVGACLDKER